MVRSRRTEKLEKVVSFQSKTVPRHPQTVHYISIGYDTVSHASSTENGKCGEADGIGVALGAEITTGSGSRVLPSTTGDSR